ncbi:MAG: uracil-DNA glycosylase family protein [Halobacteriaceae archaeon]
MSRMEDLAVCDCTACPALVDSRTRIVNGVGDPDADLLFVGEAPGETEDAEGEPFVGRSGDVLTDALSDHGLSRADVRITNCVRCRPPENRDPTEEELTNCRDWLETEIEQVDPDLVVALGKVPSQHLLGRDVAVTNEAGTVETASVDGPRDVLICVHPAATLYDPGQRETFAEAMATAVDRTDGGGGDQRALDDF